MSALRHFSCLLSTGALLSSQALAQNPTAATPAAAASEHIERLDKFVVSAGPDPKTAFDLAQGTSVLTGDELRRATQATLGETLANTPGVNSSSFGPGAARPLIRGLGGDRIRVLDNGIGALDASNVSPDHNTALEPLFASRIEVLRGPSTLLYGSSAVGGAVNVIDNSIPETAADGKLHGAAELRFGGAGRERAGVVSAGGGGGPFVLQVNLLKQKTDDARIPGIARIDADAPSNQVTGTLPDSATATWSGSVGGSHFWKTGHAGAAVMHYETEYGVPTAEPGLSIRMRQTRYDLAGESTQAFGMIRSVKARFGYGDYTHSEIADGTTVNTTFKNRAAEGRLELAHAAIGALTGTFGVQGTRSDFSAVGEEVVTPPSITANRAIFAVEELKLSERATLEFGGRLEGQSIKLGAVDSALPRVSGFAARSGQKKKSSAASGSVGIVIHPAKDWSIGAALAYTGRLPTPQELFSNGPHGGTGAYEVGRSGLGNERSTGFDLSLRRRSGFVTGSVGAFVNRFSGYIFEEELPAGAIPVMNNPDGLTPFQFVARDARFYGGEAELTLHFVEGKSRHLHLDLKSDYVCAQDTTSDQPLPRIPPLRYGARLGFEQNGWQADLEVRRVERQHRTAATESPTRGYTLVSASLGYTIATPHADYDLFLRGTNLGNAEAREHTSFLKEFAPLPGRGIAGGVRITF